jgi:hypothetical protein
MKTIEQARKKQIMITEVEFFERVNATRFAKAIRRRGGGAAVRGNNVVLGAIPASVVTDAELAIGATAAQKWTR